LSEEFQKLGWIEGRNLKLDFRFGNGDATQTLAFAADLAIRHERHAPVFPANAAKTAHSASPAITGFLMFVSSCCSSLLGWKSPRSHRIKT
jgi:hypothetical protein